MLSPRRTQIILRVISALIASTCILPSLRAQDPRAWISGRVLDPSRAAIPGVEVKAIHEATGVTTAGLTNEQGYYELAYLVPGLYEITAELSGFKRYQRRGIELRVNDRLALDIVMEVGAVTDTVFVMGQTPLLETGTASLGQVVDNRRLVELPLSGGNPFVLTRLAAGVLNFAAPNHPSLAPAVEVVSNIAVSGTRDHNSEYTIDGSSSMWGRNAAFVPPADMVEEFKVQTSAYDASAGHSPGGQVNVVLRSGTNNLHGTLYHYHNDNVLQGTDFFQRQFLYDPATGPVTEAKRKTVAPQHVINRYGGTVSGPLRLPRGYDGRNRTFWIYGFEGFIRPGTERGNYFYTVPTLKQRRGDFSELLALGPQYQIYDPATITPAGGGRFSRQPFPGNIIPTERLSPMAQQLLNYWPEPNVAGSADGRNNYFRPIRSRNEYSSHTVRVDHSFTQNHRVFGRYNQAHQLFVSGQTFPNIANGNERHRYSKGFGFDDVYVFSPQLLMNFRYGFTRFIETFKPFGTGFDLVGAGFSPALVSRIDPQGITFPQISVDQYTTLGTSFASSEFTNYHTWALDWTKTRGRHSIRFGGEYRLLRGNGYRFNFQTPGLEFGTTWTRGPLDTSPAAPIGQGLASFLLGVPTGGRIDVNASYADQSTFTAFYVQDDWKAMDRLTLNIGLRYELEGPITERFNRSVRDFDALTPSPIEATARANYARNPIPEVPVERFRVLGGLTFAGTAGRPRSLWRADKNNVSPRFGLAYSVTKTTVVRAGYGVFFVPLGVDRTGVNQSGFTQRTNLVPSLDNGQTFIASLSNPFPNGFQAPLGAAGGLQTDLGLSISAFNPAPRNGYVQRWSLSLQREWPARVVMEIAYVGNRASKLPVARELNPVPAHYLSRLPVRDQAVIDFLSAQVPNPFYPQLPGTNLAGQTVARSQLLRPFPQFSGVSVTQPIGYSWYHALQISVDRRFAAGFTAQANYTWSKFIEATGFLNPSDQALEKVISDQDRPHRFVASGIWELPIGPGQWIGGQTHGWVAQLLRGWQIQGIYQTQSGAPLGFGNAIFTGNVNDIPLSKEERTVARWFNTEAGFERDPTRQLASNIRTLSTRFTGLRAHALDMWDLSVIKNFRLTERARLQFRSEWLNAFNHSQFAAPNTNPASTLFGRVSATVGFPRQIYFALKLLF